MSEKTGVSAYEDIRDKILLIRGQRVLLDADLAALYGVTTKRLNEQVKRNGKRFPEDFMFLLTFQEVEILRSQIATSSWGGARHRPFAFTEHGAIMAASILSSDRAVEARIVLGCRISIIHFPKRVGPHLMLMVFLRESTRCNKSIMKIRPFHA
jgi:hypothetical protein